jgi:nucleoside-diphosphate-sugar epimerase
MLTDEKILITGPAGQIAFPMTRSLVADNEVWGIARFGDAATRDRVDALGVTTRAIDLATGEFGDLPEDFTFVLHLAAFQGPGLDYDGAIRANAEGTGLLMHHCRAAKGILVMSTHSVYKPVEDHAHVFLETDPLGDVNAAHAPTYSVSKIGQEAVARTCARLLGIPTIIARMNASYGPNGGLPAQHLDAIVAGRPVVTRWDPCFYSPIYEDDINAQVEGLLGGAAVPAPIVNWAGDEPVSVQEWCAYIGELAGKRAEVEVRYPPGTLRGSIADVSKRRALTGPCQVGWKDGLRRTYDARAAAM